MAGGGVSRESGTQRVDLGGVGTTNSALDVNASFTGTTAAAVTDDWQDY